MTIFNLEKENVELYIFLLVHILFLLTALTCVFFFIVKPLTKDIWDDVVGMYNTLIATYVKENINTGQSEASQEDINIMRKNQVVKNDAINFTFLVGTIVTFIGFILYLVFIYYYKTQFDYKNIVVHGTCGFLIVAMVYTLFTFSFIGKYYTLNTNKAVKSMLVTLQNSLYPNKKMDDIYKQ